MSIQYVENSFRKIDEKTIEFKIKNMVGSGRASISPRIFIDNKDVTERASMKIREEDFKKIEQKMDLDARYGDEITIRVDLDEKIEPGTHNIKAQIEINWPIWITLKSEFKVKV
ncbi:MAG: hypothetical protein QXL51_07315 [Candidatus Aenigmatarchaeota archaeon]